MSFGTAVTSQYSHLTVPSRGARQPALGWLSSALLSLCAFSASWTAAAIGQFNVVDYALAAVTVIAVLAWGLRQRTMIIHGWMLLPVAGAFFVALADVFLNGGLTFEWLMVVRIFLSTTLIAILSLSEMEQGGMPRILRLAKWWVAGIVVNAAVAVLVALGLVSLDGVLVQPTGERLSGLSSHPNSIAFSISIAIPILVFLIAGGSNSRIERLCWSLGLAVSVYGMLLADSRAGLIVGMSALAISMLIALRSSRLRAVALPLTLLSALAVWLWAVPALMGTRLAPGEGALSNVGREQFNARALEKFLGSPVWGEGFDAQGGVSVPLQVLSAGGLIFAICYYTFIMVPTWRLVATRQNPLARYGAVVVAAIIGFSLLNPVFSERAAFWIPLLLAAGIASRGKVLSESTPPPLPNR